ELSGRSVLPLGWRPPLGLPGFAPWHRPPTGHSELEETLPLRPCRPTWQAVHRMSSGRPTGSVDGGVHSGGARPRSGAACSRPSSLLDVRPMPRPRAVVAELVDALA